MKRYVALLRGINVGGRNKIAMADLRTCFEEMGFAAVRTYIQSGNVVFEAEEAAREALARRLEAGLAQAFDYEARVVVRSAEEMRAAVENAPQQFGSEPDLYRYDVIFLKEPLTADEAMTHITAKEGVDEVVAGEGVLYFKRLISKATQSRMNRITATPIYPQITIRNWRTTGKVWAMMDATDK